MEGNSKLISFSLLLCFILSGTLQFYCKFQGIFKSLYFLIHHLYNFIPILSFPGAPLKNIYYHNIVLFEYPKETICKLSSSYL